VSFPKFPSFSAERLAAMGEFFSDPPWWFYVVLILLLIGLGGFFIYQRNKRPED
jgi:hypothetical protein